MMTEKDAREKWCPHARVCATETDTVIAPAHVGYNRVYVVAKGPANFSDPCSANPQASRCIASDCMMWQWVNMTGYSANAARKGFCGIAGKPE